jgi:molybdopterin/thiamine biosynthesis adenylyltransferase
VGAIALTEGIAFTEIEAVEVLFNATAIPIAAGGVNGAEGSISLFIEGEDEEIARAYEFFKDLKGEPPFPKVDRVK